MIANNAVEAAAKALYALENEGRSACPFDELPQVESDCRIEMARVAIEAAAPYLMEQAWDECASLPSRPDRSANPCRRGASIRDMVGVLGADWTQGKNSVDYARQQREESFSQRISRLSMEKMERQWRNEQ